jgi:hypothetical protein
MTSFLGRRIERGTVRGPGYAHGLRPPSAHVRQARAGAPKGLKMRTSLIKRIGKLEGTMMQDIDNKPADLSMLSMEEVDVLEKVLDYTLAREAAAPTGKRPLVAEPSGLSADDMVIYRKMAERAECR